MSSPRGNLRSERWVSGWRVARIVHAMLTNFCSDGGSIASAMAADRVVAKLRVVVQQNGFAYCFVHNHSSCYRGADPRGAAVIAQVPGATHDGRGAARVQGRQLPRGQCDEADTASTTVTCPRLPLVHASHRANRLRCAPIDHPNSSAPSFTRAPQSPTASPRSSSRSSTSQLPPEPLMYTSVYSPVQHSSHS